MSALRTYCRICEAACGLVVETNAAGVPTAIRPDRDHPVSHGFVCAKGTRFLDVARHPQRLTSPMRRQSDGTLARASWDEAMGMVRDRLRPILKRHGPHAVGVYFGNPIAFNALGSGALLAFLKTLGSRNVYSAGTQDCGNKFAGAQIVHGSPVIHPIPDFDRARVALLFGTNPAVSQSSFVHLEGGSLAFERMVARGARVVWIDPRRTESAKRWGEHVAIRPGTDVWLLLALLRELGGEYRPHAHETGLERLLEVAADVTPEVAAAKTGIEPARIRELAELLRTVRPAALHMSVGVNQGEFGTLAYVVLQALTYLTGNFDREGGSIVHPFAVLGAKAFRALGIGTSRHTSRIGGFTSVLDALPGGILADEILTPGAEQIRAMVVIGGDPVASIPGEAKLRAALRSLELLVSVDLFENRTGALSHLLLPATSWLERWDVATTTIPFHLAPLVQSSGPVMQAPGEARHETRVLFDLLAAMGKGRWLAPLARVPLDWLLPSGEYGFRVQRPRAGSYLGRGPLTPGHQIRFWDAALEPEVARLDAWRAPSLAGSFSLIGRRRRLGHNGWLHGGHRDGDAEGAAWMTAEDLASIGAPGGGRVEIRTDAGAIQIDAVPAEGLAAGTVVVPHGVPGINVNAIIPSGEHAVERLSGQHWMTGIAARVTVAQV